MQNIDGTSTESVKALLHKLLIRSVSSSGMEWLDRKTSVTVGSNQKREAFLAFSSASRFVGKNVVQLSDEDLLEIKNIRPGWQPDGWTTDQVARILLILSIPNQDSDYFDQILCQIFETADVSELTALYLGLPLYLYPEKYKLRTLEGFRSNMNVVFNAIALNNPYPKEYLDEASWNQMVLKAIFVGSPLYKIQGIDERTNVVLADILIDFAHERWSAGRLVTPELWRCVGPFVNNSNIIDIERLFASKNCLQEEAAALVCSCSSFEPAKALLSRYPEVLSKIANKELTWNVLGNAYENKSI